MIKLEYLDSANCFKSFQNLELNDVTLKEAHQIINFITITEPHNRHIEQNGGYEDLLWLFFNQIWDICSTFALCGNYCISKKLLEVGNLLIINFISLALLNWEYINLF